MRQFTAYHEAGHAVVAYRLGIEVRRVSVVPEGHGNAGYCEYGSVFGGENLDRVIQISLAGAAAQQRFNRRSFRRWHARRDYDRALGLSRYVAGASGERDYFNYQMRVTRRLVERHWPDIVSVALALLRDDVLDRAAVIGLLDLEEEDRITKARWDRAEAEGFFDSPE
jgi:hypothetical protein